MWYPTVYNTVCMGQAVRLAAQVEGVVAEVVWHVFECDQGTGTHMAAIPPSTWGAETSYSLQICTNIDAKALHWPHDGRSVRPGAMHALAPLVDPATMRHECALTVIPPLPCVPVS